MSLNENLKIKKIIDPTSKGNFRGQVKVNDTIGVYNSTQKVFEVFNNVNKIYQPYGIGRLVFPDYIFEGYIDIDHFNSPGFNKVFRIITKDAIHVYNSKEVTKDETIEYQ